MRKISAAVVLLVLLVACGANARRQTLQTQLVILNVSRDTVLEVSRRREAQIVEDAKTREEGRAALDAWRARVDPVIEAIGKGYRVIASAALLSDSTSAAEAVAAVAKAAQLAKELGP